MDVRKFAVEETGVIELIDASDNPMMGDDGARMTITVYSPGSKEFARAQAKQSNRNINKLRKKGEINETPEQKQKENAEYLASVTKEFSPNIEYDGLKGEELFRAVYADTSIGFIADQVAKYLADWGNFTKGLPKP